MSRNITNFKLSIMCDLLSGHQANTLEKKHYIEKDILLKRHETLRRILKIKDIEMNG